MATLKPEQNVKPLAKPKRVPQRLILKRNFPSLISQISTGSSLRSILPKIGVCWDSFFDYLDSCPKAKEQYSRARIRRVESYVDELVPMSDAVIGEDMNVVTATRNAVDVRKWVASKLMPREYGEAGSGGITVQGNANILVMSDEKLRALQETRRKMLLENSNNASSV